MSFFWSQRGLHKSPLGYTQSFQTQLRIRMRASEIAVLVTYPVTEGCPPGMPQRTETPFRGHKAGEWLQHKAPLGGAGSCSMCT